MRIFITNIEFEKCQRPAENICGTLGTMHHACGFSECDYRNITLNSVKLKNVVWTY